MCNADTHYYLPGVTPNAWDDGESVALKTNHVTSTQSPIQYDYYDLPFCKKSKKTKAKSDNIGETLSGDSVTVSPYELKMKKDETCQVLCRKEHKKAEVAMFRSMIDQEYRIHWLLDNLPVAERNSELGYVTRGYAVGFTLIKNKKPLHYLYNHVRIVVRYSEEVREEHTMLYC